MRSTVYCIDAGVVVRRFQSRYPEVRALWQRFRRDRATLVAPLLLRYEVTNAFHRLRQAGDLDDADIERQFDRAWELSIEYSDDVGLHAEAARIAARHGLPAAYDAHYLALAERLGVDLFTTDARLAKAVGDDLPWVRLVR